MLPSVAALLPVTDERSSPFLHKPCSGPHINCTLAVGTVAVVGPVPVQAASMTARMMQYGLLYVRQGWNQSLGSF